MKQILELMDFAWKLGIKVTEITVTREVMTDLLTELGGLAVTKDMTLKFLETPYGRVKIKIIK